MNKFAYLASSAVALVMATSAIAADLPYRRQAPAYSAPPVFTNFGWQGLYIGGNLGWRAANFDPVVNNLEIEGKTRHSAAIGGHVGYNFQVSPNIVLGVEADMGYGKNKAAGPTVAVGPGLLSSGASIAWAGSVRGRLGYTQDNWMLYGTGGFAFADLEATTSYSTLGTIYTSKNDKWAGGYAVGGGVEYMVMPNITVRGEYLYSDYGRQTVSAPIGGQSSIDVTTHTARAGVSYKF